MEEISVTNIFNEGRTCYKFSNTLVDNKILIEIYDLMKLGPTATNCCPLRMLFVSSESAKEKLLMHLDQGNIDKVKSAPVTVLFAYDSKFYNKLPELFPIYPALADHFANNPQDSTDSAFRNSTLQAAYFMMIARGKGLSCGPMSGFNAEGINKEFFAEDDLKINFICNLGYPAGENPYPRLPRLKFDQACKIL